MLSRARPWSNLAAPPALLFALVGLILLSSPVRAAQAPPDDGTLLQNAGSELPAEVRDDVLELLFLEIALIEHLDGFGNSPERISEIHDAYESWPDVGRAALVGLTLETDTLLDELHRSIIKDTGATIRFGASLTLLSAPERDRLINNAPDAIQVLPYMWTLAELIGDDPAAPGSAADDSAVPATDDLAALLDRIVDPGELNRLTTETAALRDRVDEVQTDNGGTSWSVVVLIAAAGLLAGALISATWLRRRRAILSDPVNAEVLEAHRRLAGALDEGEVATIGCRTAASITDATDAFIFRRVDGGLRRIGGIGVIAHSVLTRVVETGQPLLVTVGDDPAVSTASICVVPLVADGRVDGVLVARRAAGEPFDDESLRRLEVLGPALAGALSGADQLGSYENLAMVDGLTALGNRRRLDGDLEAALNQAAEHQLPVGFAMIDVDSFKAYNDSHGHEAGDRALQAVARIIESAVRTSDVVYRYGGEEFSVLLPGASRQEAQAAGERIRAAVERAPFDGEESQPGGHLTVSVGVATLEGGAAETLKSRADEALYGAKALGRNRIVID